MEKGSEGWKGLHKEAWKDEIDATKAGAGYFLSIKGRPEFNPSEYISFRGLTLSEAQQLLPAEWVGWIQYLRTSTYEHVQRRAVSAPSMTFDDIYRFYKTRILDNHELEILGESSQQVVSGGHQLASLLQERQRLSLSVPGPASGDFARIPSTAGRKHPRDPWDGDHRNLHGAPSSSARTPPYQHGSKTPSPTLSPPERPRFQETSSDDEDEIVNSRIPDIFQDDTPATGTSQSQTWIQERPAFTFRLPLRNEWGPKVTELYDAARSKTSFTHKNLDEISLLSGILHINKTHIGLNADEISAVRRDILARFYSLQMQAMDMQRAEHAATFWNSITQKFKSMKLRYDLAKATGVPDLADLSMQPILDMIMEAYKTCKEQQILPLHAIAQYVFRHMDDWGILESESDAMASVVAPILQEFLRVPGQIKFKCLNASCTAGRTRKAALEHDGQARQPDVVGRTRDKREAYFGELKGPHPRTLSKDADLLRLAVFTKDTLDSFCNELEQDPPILSFQSVGRVVTFFLGAKVDNTVVHARLSEVNLPSLLTELSLDQEVFFHLFQVETLVRIASKRLERKRDAPLTDVPFPTLSTPKRDAALGIKHKVK